MSSSIPSAKADKYEKYVKSITPVHSLPMNMLKAFFTGGAFCLLGQIILNTAQNMGADRESCRKLVFSSSDIVKRDSYRAESLFTDRQSSAVQEALFQSPVLPIP